jgi:acetolactate synthase-1/3 small subunit
MAMRRGHHTSRVLKALGTNSAEETSVAYPDRPVTDDLPNQFAEDEA